MKFYNSSQTAGVVYGEYEKLFCSILVSGPDLFSRIVFWYDVLI